MLTSAVSILFLAIVYFFASYKNKSNFKYIILLYIISISLLMTISTLYIYKLTSYSFLNQMELQLYHLFTHWKPNITDISRVYNLCIALLMMSSLLFLYLFSNTKHALLLLILPILYFVITNDPAFTWMLFLRIHAPNGNAFLEQYVIINRYICTGLLLFYSFIPLVMLIFSIFHTRIRTYRRDCIVFFISLALFESFVYYTFFAGIFQNFSFNHVDLLKFPLRVPETTEIAIFIPYSIVFITLTVFTLIAFFSPLLEWKIFTRHEMAQNAKLMNQNMRVILHSYKNAFLGIERLSHLADEYMRTQNQEKLEACLEQMNQISSSNLNSITHTLNMLKNVNLKYSLVDITACIETAVYNASISPEVTIKRNYDPDKPHTLKIYGDYEYLQEAFLNLLTNADYALKNNNAPVISINILSEPDICSIEIKDNGCGIERHHRKNIFKAYYSTKSTSSNFGIGLNYVETIIKQHHGSINVYSELNQYTSFQIVLPRLREEHK